MALRFDSYSSQPVNGYFTADLFMLDGGENRTVTLKIIVGNGFRLTEESTTLIVRVFWGGNLSEEGGELVNVEDETYQTILLVIQESRWAEAIVIVPLLVIVSAVAVVVLGRRKGEVA